MAIVTDARLDIYWPFTAGGPDLQVPAEDIRSVDIETSYQAGRGGGSIVIDNGDFGSDGKYNGTAGSNNRVYEIDIGQRLEFRALTEYNADTTTLDDSAALRNTLYISGVTAVEDPTTGNQLEIDIEEYVFAVLARQTVANSYQVRQTATSGTDFAIANDIVSRIEGIDDGGILDVDVKQTIGWNYAPAIEALNDLAARSGTIMSADGTSLEFGDKRALGAVYAAQTGDYHLPVENERDGDNLLNQIYVTGGSGEKIQAQNTTTTDVDALEDGSGNDNRLTSEAITLNTPKVPRVDIYPNVNTDADDIRVRVQNTNASGDPESPTDRQDDIGSAVVEGEQLNDEDWTAFGVAVDGGDVDGNEIALIAEQIDNSPDINGVFGTDSDNDGNLETIAYRVWRSYPVVADAGDTTSQNDYGVHTGRHRTNSRTRGQAEDIAGAKLNRSTPAEEAITIDANSQVLHQASIGDGVQLDNPAIRADGTYLITKIRRSYDGTQLDTQLTTINFQAI